MLRVVVEGKQGRIGVFFLAFRSGRKRGRLSIVIDQPLMETLEIQPAVYTSKETAEEESIKGRRLDLTVRPP